MPSKITLTLQKFQTQYALYMSMNCLVEKKKEEICKVIGYQKKMANA